MTVLIAAHVGTTYFLRPDIRPVLRFNRIIRL